MAEYRERILQEVALLNLKISSDTNTLVGAAEARASAESIIANERGEKLGSRLSKLEGMTEREAKRES
jgi:hypothetical protein